ncbi:MAG: AraC family transcriptional regulator [Bacteroidota bacterium]
MRKSANQIKFINCGDLEIMVSIEGQAVEKHPYYYPAIVLLYAKKGTIVLEADKTIKKVPAGNFLLINRFSTGFMHKTWTAEEGEANVFAFVFHQEFVKKVRQQFSTNDTDRNIEVQSTYILPPNPILSGLFDSIFNYIQQEQTLDTSLVELKTMEAMMGVLNYHPECHNIFLTERPDEKLDLQQLVESNYMYNVPLSKLAQLSGRSLSTFSRDFKAIFNDSPHRWIRKRRLIKAKEMLLNTNRKPVEFYMELGFESLAHFSRVFKKEFGVTLTEFRKNNYSKLK